VTLHSVVVNGDVHHFDAETRASLLGWLRSGLGLTGAKPGCGEGACGACTVLVDGDPVLACQTHLGDVAGSTITTVEGLGHAGRLHRVQEAFVAEGASQCGYCTPAMALRAAALLARHPDPDDEQIAEALDPNLCRCGCYRRIARAVRRAAETNLDEPSTAAPSDLPGEPALPRPRRPWDLSAPEEREWFEVLGDGLVAVWPPQPARPGMWTTDGGAWLHVAPSGRVTAFSGKVDVGQDPSTAFRLLVAEELDVELDDVRIVLGDTDLCPFDMGTFGSRSMPDAGQALRRAAAGARAFLMALAAKNWQVDSEGLSGVAGVVIGGPSGASAPYGTLVASNRILEVLGAEPELKAPGEWRLVGRAGHMASRVAAVTGALRFASDIELPAIVHGAVLRPPVRGSTLRKLDATKAEAMGGVTVVRDGDFLGVTAASPMLARQAVSAVQAEWDEPPAIAGSLEAYLRANPLAGEGWQRAVDDASGDLEAAFKQAAIHIDASYSTAYIAHTPLETRAAVAEWQHERLTVWTGTQVPFGVRSQVADALGLDESSVRVVVAATGGGFGGKHAGGVAIEAARLARAVGQPVKVHWSRAEEFRWGQLRPMAVIDIRAAADAAGSITAWDFLDVNAGSAGLDTPYAIPNRRLRYQPASSPLAQGSYRALAATANNFARESHIDDLAHGTGLDPLEFRLRNLADERLAAVMRAGAERFGWGSTSPGDDGTLGESRGSGLAVGLEKSGRVATFVEVAISGEGALRVVRVLTAYDCGAIVNRDTVVNQIEGGTIMAIGGAVFEEVPLEAGRFAEPSLKAYRVPRFSDAPVIEVLLVDRPDLPSAGAGETPIIALAPALANAIFAATRQRLRSLPLAPGGRIPG